MDVIIYIAILSIGVVFGSFFTLAIHRIPLKEDITHVRSYCPNCNHKLKFLDLIPVLSYIFLLGKCRYCKDKIRIRYFLLEVFSGLVFVLIAFIRGISINSNITELTILAITYMFIAGVFIIAGIDKENKEIPNGLIIYELLIGVVWIIYKKVMNIEIFTNMVGFLVIPLILLIINLLIGILYRDENKLPFGMGDIKYIAIIGLFLGFGAQIITIVLSLFITLIGVILNSKKDTIIPWGFYLSISVILVIIFSNYLEETIHLIEITL